MLIYWYHNINNSLWKPHFCDIFKAVTNKGPRLGHSKTVSRTLEGSYKIIVLKSKIKL